MYDPNNQPPPQNGIPVIPPPSRPRRGPGKWLIFSVLLVVVGLSSGLMIQNKVRQGAFAEPSATIRITPNGFVPAIVTIKAGQSVEWINDDDMAHELTTDTVQSKEITVFSEDPIRPGKSFKVKFDKAGTYPYHDPKTMTSFKGTVIVR